MYLSFSILIILINMYKKNSYAHIHSKTQQRILELKIMIPVFVMALTELLRFMAFRDLDGFLNAVLATTVLAAHTLETIV